MKKTNLSVLTAIFLFGIILIANSESLKIKIYLYSLRSNDNEIRHNAAKKLSEYGPKILPTLINKLNDENEMTRAGSICALTYLGPEAKSAVPLLILALNDNNDEVQWRAASALGYIGKDAESAVPALIRAINNNNVRLEVVDTLGNIGPKAAPAIPVLIEVLNDSKWKNRYGRLYSSQEAAAKALGKIGPAATSAIPHLSETMNNRKGDWAVRAQSALALLEIDFNEYNDITLPFWFEAANCDNSEVRILAQAKLDNLRTK